MNKELFEVLDWMKDCINELHESIEVLEDKHGYLISRSNLYHMNETMKKLEVKLKKEGNTHES